MCQVSIKPHANSQWGEWGSESFCPDNSWAQGFMLKIEPDQGNIVDDSALNGIELKCFDVHDEYKGSSTSLVGDIGSWISAEYCGSKSFMTGVRFRSKDPSASLDETAGNNLDVSCDNGQTLYGNGLYWGEWSDWVQCPANTAICGIKTRGRYATN